MKRRAFLAASGALTVSFVAGCSSFPVIPNRPKPNVEQARAWIRFERDRYTLFIPRVEMGQNIATALKQIACDELGIAWSLLDVKLHDTRSISAVRATVGSESIKDFAVPLAQACATLRDSLARGEISGTIDVVERPLSELRALAGGGRYVGQRVAVEQSEAIIRGWPLYASDVRRAGMVYGRVLRAPVSPELVSKQMSWDCEAARKIPGFVAIIESALLQQIASRGLGIAGATPGALDRIEAALAVKWHTEGSFTQQTLDDAIDVDRRLAAGALPHTVSNDSLDATDRWDVDLRIDMPLAAHAAIEPRVAVAEFDGLSAMQLWVGSQDVFYQRDVIAKRLSLSAEKVIVHGQRVGGAFGGKTICTVELEAAVLAFELKKPVKVQWTRAQEFQLGFHRPPSSHRIRATVANGKIDQWRHSFVSGHILFTNAVVPHWIQRFTDYIGDDGVARCAMLAYRARKKRTEFDLVRLPVFTGPWRGLGAGPNLLAIESAIDECARVAKVSPVTFRVNNAIDARLARVLLRADSESGKQPLSQSSDARLKRGRGVACGVYKSMSYAAVIADVEVDSLSGNVRVIKLWCAHDCGKIINPDQVRAQCEGNLVWGIGMIFSDRLPVANSQVAATTFLDSPIPRMSDVPPMQISLVDEGDAPTGAGETVIVAAAGAIANAIRDATGKRLTRFPLNSQDLRA